MNGHHGLSLCRGTGLVTSTKWEWMYVVGTALWTRNLGPFLIPPCSYSMQAPVSYLPIISPRIACTPGHAQPQSCRHKSSFGV